VLAAKLAASAVLALVALAFCLVVAAVATAVISPGVGDTWALPAGMLVQIAVVLVTGMVGGVAFGAVVLASAPAIVALFVLPTVTGALGSIPVLEGAARWLDGTRTLAPMTDHLMDATEWARAGTTLALWMVLRSSSACGGSPATRSRDRP
jgi:ABC-2 type transport system permease protein